MGWGGGGVILGRVYTKYAERVSESKVRTWKIGANFKRILIEMTP